MKKQLTMIYIGDMRGNKRVMMANHLTLITRLQDLVDVHTEAFTKDSDRRGPNPYEHDESGAVELWDFVDALERTSGDIVMKMRTDVWFTPMAVDLICDAVQRILDDQADVFYISNAIKLPTDSVIIARRDRLRPCQEIKQQIADTPVQKSTARTHSVFANIWLIRDTYDPEHFPSDWDVCRDYIQSHIEAKDGGIENMQFAVNWWREQQGWSPQEIDPHNVRKWQSR